MSHISQNEADENASNWRPGDDVLLLEACQTDLPNLLSQHDSVVRKLTETLPVGSIYTRLLLMHLHHEIRDDMIWRASWSGKECLKFKEEYSE